MGPLLSTPGQLRYQADPFCLSWRSWDDSEEIPEQRGAKYLDHIPASSLVLSSAEGTQEWREPPIDRPTVSWIPLGEGGSGGFLRGFWVTSVQ